MLRPLVLIIFLAIAIIIYTLRLTHQHYVFQQYLTSRYISPTHFPPSYATALNASVSIGAEPLDFDYASIFPQSTTRIPRIIHFIHFPHLYPGKDAIQTPTRPSSFCRKFNPSLDIRVWNVTDARSFLATTYPPYYIP
jgi:hypothetical protein